MSLFKNMGRADRILALIIDGEPNVGDKPGSDGQQECFCSSLRFNLLPDGQLSQVRTEPVAADVRPGGDGRRDAFLKLVAGVLGIRFDAIKRRDLQRRQRRLLWLSALGLGVLMIITYLAIAAWLGWGRAEDLAIKNETLATTEKKLRLEAEQKLAISAMDRGLLLCDRGEIRHGMLWLARSLEIAPADMADLKHAVRCNLAEWSGSLAPQQAVLMHEGRVLKVAFSPDGRFLLTRSSGAAGQTIHLRNVATGKNLFAVSSHLGVFSPDGRYLAVVQGKPGSDESAGTLIWDLSSRAMASRLLRDDWPILPLCFSPNGEFLVTGSPIRVTDTDGPRSQTRVWTTSTGKPFGKSITHEGSVDTVFFHPNGKAFLTATQSSNRTLTLGLDGEARFWRMETGEPIGPPLHFFGKVLAFAFDPNGSNLLLATGRKVVTAGPNGVAPYGRGKAWLWRNPYHDALTPPQEPVALVHAWGPVLEVAFSENGKLALTGGQNGFGLWNATSAKPICAPYIFQERIDAIAFSPKGCLIFADGRNARLWKTPDGSQKMRALAHQNYRYPLALSKTWRCILLSRNPMSIGNSDKTGLLWDAQTGKVIGSPFRHSSPITAAAFSADGLVAATVDADGMRLWDAATAKPLGDPLPQAGGVFEVVFSQRGRFLLARGEEEIRLWSFPLKEPVGAVLAKAESGRNRLGVAGFSPDGRTAFTGTSAVSATPNSVLQLWDTASDRAIGKPIRLTYSPSSVTLSQNAQVLLTDERLWDAATGLPIGPPINGITASSPDCMTVLVTKGNEARLYDTRIGDPLGAPMRHEFAIRAAAFSPDGKAVLTASGPQVISMGLHSLRWKPRGQARLWDARSGQPLCSPLEHSAPIRSIAFSPGGRMFVTGTWGDVIRLWNTSQAKPIGPEMRGAPVGILTFSSDGTMLIGRPYNDIPMWAKPMPIPVDADARRTSLWVQVITGMELAEGGGAHLLSDESWSNRRKHLLEPRRRDDVPIPGRSVAGGE